MRLPNTLTGPRLRQGRRAAVSVSLVLTAGLALAGCTPTAEEPDSDPVAESTETSAETAPATIPDTQIGDTMQWAIDMLNSSEDPTVAEIEAKFSDQFLKAVPVEEFLAQTNTAIRPAGPFELSAYEEADELSAVATLEGEVSGAVQLQVGLNEQGEIAVMLVSPAP